MGRDTALRMTTENPSATSEEELVQITISSLPPDLLEKIDRLAKAERRSRSAFIVSRLERAVKDQEGNQLAA
jgi:metal-responsive CopG/Arc/MetJ family transcriptional regulator